MKKIKVFVVIFLLVFTVAMAVSHQAYAQPAPAGSPAGSAAAPAPAGNANTKTVPVASNQEIPDTGSSTSKIMDFLNRVLFAIAYFLGTLAMKLFAYVVMISSYNDFVTSEAVNKGWILIRDICNMFFVVILLIIAFAQILRVEKYSMKTLLPKVLIAAVLVNFSKLICGLLIDFAQIIMMTFVNGYQATAGANLVVGLGFTKLLKMSAKATTTSIDPGYTNTDIFLALAMGVVFLVLVIVVTFLILVLLTVRIVTLWILVVLSPFAFLLSDLPFGQSYATEWWKKFGEQVVIGPFLAFFLWLSLLMMSNPDQMISPEIKKAQEAIEKSTGGGQQASVQLDQMAQFFIGLAMLLASFEMAQRMGGATAKWAGKVSTMSKTAGRKLRKFAGKTAYKVTGAKAVVKRGQAVYGGFMAKQKAKQDDKFKKWTERGEKVFNAKEGAVRKAKQGVRAGVETVKGRAFTQKGRAILADRVNNAGMIEKLGIDATRQAHRTRIIEQGNKMLDAQGIKSPQELMNLVNNDKAKKEMRQAAALKLAEKGMFDDKKDKDGKVITGAGAVSAVEYAQQAKELLKGNRASSSAFGDALEKKQMSIAYHLADDKGKGVIATKLKSGDMDLRKQDENSDKDKQWMQFALDKLGGKSFGKIMQDRAGYSETHKENIKQTITDIAKDPITGLKKRQPTQRYGADGKETADYKNFDGFRKAVANITGDADLAYTGKDGKLDTAGLKEYMQTATTPQITNLDIKPTSDIHIAQNITNAQMGNMAVSGEGQKQFDKIAAKMVDMAEHGDDNTKQLMVGKLENLISSERTRTALDDAMRGKIESILAGAQATKTAAENAAKATEQAATDKKAQEAAVKASAEARKKTTEEWGKNFLNIK